MQRRVREPAGAAERGRGEEGAPRMEPGCPQPLRPEVEKRVDPGRERGALDCDLSVALDERDDDVLSAQVAEQPIARGGAEAVATDLLGEDRAVPDAGAHGLYLVDGQAGGARRRDRHLGKEVRSERPTEPPDSGERGDGAEGPPAVTGLGPGPD